MSCLDDCLTIVISTNARKFNNWLIQFIDFGVNKMFPFYDNLLRGSNVLNYYYYYFFAEYSAI